MSPTPRTPGIRRSGGNQTYVVCQTCRNENQDPGGDLRSWACGVCGHQTLVRVPKKTVAQPNGNAFGFGAVGVAIGAALGGPAGAVLGGIIGAVTGSVTGGRKK